MKQETQIMEKINKIEQEVMEIKAHMADVDSIMTEEDYEALLAYREEKAAGKLTSRVDIVKELGS
ncbi:MAG: hypothetical protein ISS93_01110 [Candidatus Aenigmarchaeota archaeon]|nr:hypothetical protein [Candidatus Aenigmarchaeota archaeon]